MTFGYSTSLHAYATCMKTVLFTANLLHVVDCYIAFVGEGRGTQVTVPMLHVILSRKTTCPRRAGDNGASARAIFSTPRYQKNLRWRNTFPSLSTTNIERSKELAIILHLQLKVVAFRFHYCSQVSVSIPLHSVCKYYSPA